MQVALEDVSISFQKQRVLQNIHLRIQQNEIFGFIGPSGAGKTTLIRLIIGAVGADTGAIHVGSHTMPDLGVLRQIGYMPQNDALYSDLSGLENLMFFGGMYGLPKAELRKRANELLQFVELTGDAGKKVTHYSGGMKKRLSLAAALMHKPDLLILDEPTVGIDPLLRRKIWDQFRALKQQGMTILLTTHVMDEAVKCDRLGLLYGGKIIACDTVGALLSRTKDNSIEELFFEIGGKA